LIQNRKIKIQQSQIDTCILQFKELGLVEFAEKREENGRVFRGVTLTELGERRLTLLNTHLREHKNLVGDFSRGNRLVVRSRKAKKVRNCRSTKLLLGSIRLLCHTRMLSCPVVRAEAADERSPVLPFGRRGHALALHR